MIRTKVKGTRFKAASSPESEPDFYKMNPVIVTPHNSSDEEYSYGTETTSQQPSYAAAAPQVPSFDPLPMSFAGMSAEPRAFEAAPASIPYAAYPESMQDRSYADQVLDEAVDELFLQEALQESDPIIGAWDAASFGDDASLQDEQLGMLLEQLLDE